MRPITKKAIVLWLIFSLTLLLPNTAAAAWKGFADVPENAACYESVMYLAEHGITGGTSPDSFSPEQAITVRQWAVMLCRAYGIKCSGKVWPEVSQTNVEEACKRGWLNTTAVIAPDTQMCRGALLESAFAAANIPVYDSVLYENGKLLSAYENYIRVGAELGLCSADEISVEIVSRGEAARLLYVLLTQDLQVKEPPAPIPVENRASANSNDFLLELHLVPEQILRAFHAHGWKYTIAPEYIAQFSEQFGMNCIGLTSYAQRTIYVSDASATLHEFGHFLEGALNFPYEHERLYRAEAKNACLRNYAKTNAAEYFADCFAYWIRYRNDAETMSALKQTVPQTYAYFERLEANHWNL